MDKETLKEILDWIYNNDSAPSYEAQLLLPTEFFSFLESLVKNQSTNN